MFLFGWLSGAYTVDNYHPFFDLVIKFKNSSVSDFYQSSYIFNFKKCNFNDISLFIFNIDFDLNLNKNLSLDALVDTFYEIILFWKLKFIIIITLYGQMRSSEIL